MHILRFPVSLMFIAGITASTVAQPAIYKDSTAAIDARVADLLPRLTLEEKIDLLGGTGFATKPIPRLGIPELRMTDGPLGVRWGKSTAMPSGICVAATWNPDVARAVGAAIGREVKGHDRHVILGPCVNIARIPQGGRNFESYGEDPYLASRTAVSYIQGVQSEGVAATVKHFACNNQEFERMFVDVTVGARALNEIYFPAFKAAVQESDVLCVMNAYNKVNGHFASENNFLLQETLKKKWGFQGLVMSDWGAVHSALPTVSGGMDLEMPTGEYLNAGTLLAAVKSGTVKESTIDEKVRRILRTEFRLGLFEHPSSRDERLLGSEENRRAAYEGAKQGIVLLKNDDKALPLDFQKLKTLAVIGPNAGVCRSGGGGSSRVDPISAPSPLKVLQDELGFPVQVKYAAGVQLDGEALPVGTEFLETPSGEPGLNAEYFANMDLKGSPVFTRTDPHVWFHFSEESPRPGFPGNDFSVRWTGSLRPKQTGEYTLDLTGDDGMRLWVDGRLLIEDWSDHAPESRQEKMTLEAGKTYQIKIEYYQHGGGAVARFGWILPGEDPMAAALEAARTSEAAIVFAGTSAAYESEGFDRADLVLPKGQDDLIRRVASLNRNTIVVLSCGSPVLMDQWLGSVKAVVLTWFGGQEMGRAIADVLSGRYNPSGKLPMTFPHKWEDCSAVGTYKSASGSTEYADGIYVGYRYADKKNIEPLFPFGFGLSYTSFEYSNPKATVSGSGSEMRVDVSFSVKNSGSTGGAEVAQVYVRPVKPAVDRPVQELKAFRRLQLEPGTSGQVSLSLSRSDFSLYDEASNAWVTPVGKYEIAVGSSSRDIRLSVPVSIK